MVSPASNGGCGLKQLAHQQEGIGGGVSPASNGGCGLKHHDADRLAAVLRFHPPVMAGVD